MDRPLTNLFGRENGHARYDHDSNLVGQGEESKSANRQSEEEKKSNSHEVMSLESPEYELQEIDRNISNRVEMDSIAQSEESTAPVDRMRPSADSVHT